MSSRFFHGGDSDSESSSSEEEELYSDREEEEEEESEEEEEEEESDEDSSEDEGRGMGASRFLKPSGDAGDESDESEDEDRERVVKSAKDKRFEELESTIKAIENAEKINDWAVVSSEFDKMNRQVVKVTQQGATPKLYIKMIADLEDLINETNDKQKSGAKKMNPINAKGFNAMKQKIRKNNKEYATEIEKYRANKEEFMESDEEEPLEVEQRTRKNKVQRLDAIEAAIDEEGFATVGRGGKALVYTPESILKHLRTIIESRGKKNTDRTEQIRIMERLLDVASTPYQRIRVLLTLISTRFDVTTSSVQAYMSQESWRAAEREFSTLLQTLEDEPQYMVTEVAEEWEDDEKQPNPAAGEIFKIPGSIVSLLERLDDELTRSLQQTDPHTAEYIERLSDEQLLYTDIVRTLIYIETINKKLEKSENKQDNINRTTIRRLEHIYFKPTQVVKILEEKTWAAIPSALNSELTPRGQFTEVATLVRTLCNHLFEHSEGIIRARAMLCEIYFLALQDDYYRARDLALMSHLTENISSFDVSTQILFNRTLVQIGLCAFRAGLCYEAQGVLQEICGSGRQKELLAQGVIMQRYLTVTPEQERLERQRQLPFHMHINLELLECVYLTCSMLLEIPLLAQTGSSPDVRKRVISKTFRRMLEYTERQVFQGPPENTRDHVMQAAKALAQGDWKKCQDLISKIGIWDLLGLENKEKVKKMLAEQIQEEGLRTYLFTYAPYYDTLSITTLSGMFELDPKKIAAVVSKMISHEELAAALDQVNDAIVFRKGVELSRLQSQVITLSEKAMGILESNEKVLETRTAGMVNAFSAQGQRGAGRGGRTGGRTGLPGLPRQGQQGARRPGGQQFSGGALGGAIKA
ncbi:eukaryotic translation initiation factor 3 subunit C [Fonsecaea monophora]|uniref:Eukaryotic translation initiation factor 3 subunit C n=2 Tax=Fonsecaea TaxID=40354 RepID=A0A0D2E532_9EURO|nr:eukaryotic translation initiation factor 3 subunit C [Fonsecaea pedrosoi CBS 271.37]XP_022509614.1 eukaryotic translation initiation factor 3 subunit C [Fonsecaea monophora]KIW85211.1 eukaryotic translation initiation factor 3 subunit C [Fonsecaea pedrosoi CBS 271.37]OAG37662.1 eukaryotic translation initiation factor 3 subunit C [Fonsecaea monophora]